jgi:hypothetical protein
MAFGQDIVSFQAPQGDAPGYDEDRPSANCSWPISDILTNLGFARVPLACQCSFSNCPCCFCVINR